MRAISGVPSSISTMGGPIDSVSSLGKIRTRLNPDPKPRVYTGSLAACLHMFRTRRFTPVPDPCVYRIRISVFRQDPDPTDAKPYPDLTKIPGFLSITLFFTLQHVIFELGGGIFSGPK